MIYLERFTLPTQEQEDLFLSSIRRTCYDSRYPFHVFRYRRLPPLEFSPITIFYGENGSGKSTILNVLAEKLELPHTALYNRTHFFRDYLTLCQAETSFRFDKDAQQRSRIITSDDVFDCLLNIRTLNEGITQKREELLQEYTRAKFSSFQLGSLADYEELKKHADATRYSGSQYVRRNLMREVRTHSNGESALAYFTASIQEQGLYLLDEPENSLSPSHQVELADFLSHSARFFDCQLVISTHSPFLLAIPGAKIYDLDADPTRPRKWTELENVLVYRDFFRQHEQEFNQTGGSYG